MIKVERGKSAGTVKKYVLKDAVLYFIVFCLCYMCTVQLIVVSANIAVQSVVAYAVSCIGA